MCVHTHIHTHTHPPTYLWRLAVVHLVHTRREPHGLGHVDALVLVAAVHVDVHDVGPVLKRRDAEEGDKRDANVGEVPGIVLAKEGDGGDGEEVEDLEGQVGGWEGTTMGRWERG